ncbi:hypothetical protein Tco_0083869 [Tanacetum coccineum]
MGGAILTLVSRVKKLERTVKHLRTARLVGDAPATEGDVDVQDAVDLEGLSRMASEALGHDQATVPSEDIEERAEEEVPLRRKRSVHRRARTEFYTQAFAQFHAPRSTDVLPHADISESAGPSVGTNKGKAPMPDLEIPAEFLAEDAQARQRLEEEQASARLVQQLQAEDLPQADVPLVSEQRAKELDELLLRMTDTDWLTLMMQVGTNPALARELLGADVNEDNFIERMTAIKERKKRALADLRYRALQGKPLKQSEVTKMMRNLVKNQWCAAHNGTITMKAVTAMSKQQQRVERTSSRPSVIPAATTQPADDPDSAGGSSFHHVGSTPMSGSAVPDSAGGPLDTTGTASNIPTSAAMDSAASHHELGISPFADSDDSSSPSPVSTDHVPIDVLAEPTPGGIHAFFLDSDEDEQIGLSRVAAEPDSDDEVLAEILFRGQYVSGAGVVVVDTLPDDEILDPRVKVEPISASPSSPPRSRSKHRGVRSDTSLWDRPVDDFLSSESESDDDIEEYIPPIPYGAFKDWEIVRCPLRNTYYHVYYQENRRHRNFFYLKELLPHVYREDLLLLRRRMNRYFRLNPDVDVGLDLWRDVNLLCQSLHSDDVEVFGGTQDEGVVSGVRLYPRALFHLHPTVPDVVVAEVLILDDQDGLRGIPMSVLPLLLCYQNLDGIHFPYSCWDEKWLVQEQTAPGAKGLTSPEQTATGKGISNPLMAVMVCQKPYGIQLTNVSRVNTPGSDENRLKLYDLMYKNVKVADTMVKDHLYSKSLYHSQAWYNDSSLSCLKLWMSSSRLMVLDGGQYLWIKVFLRRSHVLTAPGNIKQTYNVEDLINMILGILILIPGKGGLFDRDLVSGFAATVCGFREMEAGFLLGNKSSKKSGLAAKVTNIEGKLLGKDGKPLKSCLKIVRLKTNQVKPVGDVCSHSVESGTKVNLNTNSPKHNIATPVTETIVPSDDTTIKPKPNLFGSEFDGVNRSGATVGVNDDTRCKQVHPKKGTMWYHFDLTNKSGRCKKRQCSFYELRSEDPNQHLKDFLKLVDSLDLEGENRERTHLRLFQFSFRDQASNWLERLLAGSITIWEDLILMDYAAGGELREEEKQRKKRKSKKRRRKTVEGNEGQEKRVETIAFIPVEMSLNYKNPDSEQLLGIMKRKLYTLMKDAISLMGRRESVFWMTSNEMYRPPSEPSRQEEFEHIVMNFILDQEERVKQLEEYMRVIINDFIQLSSEVTRRLKDKIRKEGSRMIKIEKITIYLDEEIREPLTGHKFSEDPTEKTFHNTLKSIPMNILWIRYVQLNLSNPPHF